LSTDEARLLHIDRQRGAAQRDARASGGRYELCPTCPAVGIFRHQDDVAHNSRPPPTTPKPLHELERAAFTGIAEGESDCRNASHVWITVGSKDGQAALFGARPSFCHEHLHVPPPLAKLGSFWRTRWLLVRAYLQEHRMLRLAILTDAYDVAVNNMSVHELEERFAALTRRAGADASAPLPRLVLATEDTCWIGSICSKVEKDTFVRARIVADPNAGHRFMHSQMMGTRDGLLDLIQSGLLSNETDDMKMMYRYIVADATRVAFDDDESIFANFARGFALGASKSRRHDERSMMCWDGMCAINPNGVKGVTCSTQRTGTSIFLHDAARQRTVSPLMWHINGPSLAFLSRHPTCAAAIMVLRNLSTGR